MKTLATNFVDAATNENGVRFYHRLRVFRNRNYFTAGELSSATPDYSQSAVIHYDDVRPQVSRWDPINNRLLTVVNDSGTLRFITSGSSVVTPTVGGNSISVDAYHLPALYLSSNATHCFLAWIQGTDLYRMAIDLTALYAGTAACLSTPAPQYYPGTYQNIIATGVAMGVLHYLDISSLSYLHVYEGGIVWTIYEGVDAPTNSVSPYRFMFPGEVWTDSNPVHRSRLNFSTIGYLDYWGSPIRQRSTLFMYLTAPTGEVLGQGYNHYNLFFEEPFVAIPKDLTAFYVSGSMYRGSYSLGETPKIHLVTQFTRLEEQSTGTIYNLIHTSRDGRHFSLDRSTGVSTSGLRYQANWTENGIIMSDCHRMITLPKSWETHDLVYTSGSVSNAAEMLEIGAEYIDQASGTPGSNMTIQIANGTGIFTDEPLLDEGHIALVDIGVMGASGIIWENRWDTMIISAKNITNLHQKIQLDLVHEAVWKLETNTYPMYMEIQSKQSVRDDTEELDNLYRVAQSAGLVREFSIDFWTNESGLEAGGLRAKSHEAGQSHTYWSDDLKEKLNLTDYPVVPNSFPLEVDIYGWSRTGIPDTNPNDGNNNPASGDLNDNFQPVFRVERGGTTLDITIPAASGSSPNVPETWNPTSPRAGTQPAHYTIGLSDGLDEGDIIKQVGVYVSSPNATVFHVERMDSSSIPISVNQEAGEAWTRISIPVGLTAYRTDINASASSGIQTFVNPPGFICDNGLVPPAYQNVWFHFNLFSNVLGLSEGALGDIELDVEFECLRVSTLGIGLNPGTLFNSYGSNVPNDMGTAHAGYATTGNVDGSAVGRKTTIHVSYPDDPGLTYKGYKHDGSFAVWIKSPSIYAYDDAKWKITIKNVYFRSSGTQYLLWNGNSGSVMDGDPGAADSTDTADVVYNKKGIPSVLFSEIPNHTFNFDVEAEFYLNGIGSYGGAVGLASDEKNFVGARISPSSAEIFVCRNGLDRVLASASGTFDNVRMMFQHRNGEFALYILNTATMTWGTAPLISYSWLYSDGALAADPLVMHVGAYSYIDVPRFQVAGFFADESSVIGILPGSDLTAINNFPSSGTIEINGEKYTYTGKTPIAKQPRGPFQICNIGHWDAHTNPSTGGTYGGKMAVEFQMFEWLDDTGRDDWDGYLLVSDAGYGWVVDDIEWRVTITTGGQDVYLRNRTRVYCNEINADQSVSGSDRIYLTSGFTGVVPVGTSRSLHSGGSWVFLDRDNQIILKSFAAHSGDRDSTIRDLLSTVCAWSGVRANFDGDKTTESFYTDQLGGGWHL